MLHVCNKPTFKENIKALEHTFSYFKGKMNVDAYLERLNCLHLRNAKPTLENLTQLQMSHFRKIPYANLDMHGKQRKYMRLSLEDAYDRMIVQCRGGNCLELNGGFSWLLEKLGYELYLVESHVYNGQIKRFSRALTHPFLIVTLNKKQYYVDVGTSRFVRVPIELQFDGVQRELFGTYRFLRDGNYIILERAANNVENTVWFGQVKFQNIPRKFSDFYEMNEFVQTTAHPVTYFKTLMGIHFKNSILILYGRTLSEIFFDENGQTRTDRKDMSDEELRTVIRERFTIQVDDSFEILDEPIPGKIMSSL